MDLTENTARELISALNRWSGALERHQAVLTFPEGSEARSKALACIGVTHPGDKFFSGGGAVLSADPPPSAGGGGSAEPGTIGGSGSMAGGGFVPPSSDYAVRTAIAEAKKAQEARIREAIDIGGGQTCDIAGVIRELDKAGFAIVERDRRGK